MTPDRPGALHRPAAAGRRQKRHLLEMGAAGVLAVLFFAVPAFLTREESRGQGQPAQAAGPAARGPRVRVLTTELTPAVETPALLSKPVAAARPGRPARAREDRNRRIPLGRRLVRLVAGNGRHTVQPFPTVPGAHR